MTTYEHLMISICFGCTMGWLIGDHVIMVKGFIDYIKEKVKARRKKKLNDNK